MNGVREKPFSLTVRFGQVHRYIETDGNFTHRTINLRGCPVKRRP